MQQHRCNTPAETAESYYLLNLGIPLLDHIISELDTQFNSTLLYKNSKLILIAISFQLYIGLTLTASKILCLIPSILCDTRNASLDLKSIVDAYSSDMPSLELLEAEVFRWKTTMERKYNNEVRKMPSTFKKAKECFDPTYYPNIYVLLKIFATIPATSCEFERSASVLRRLRNYEIINAF